MHFDFSKEDFQTSKTISPGGRARAGGAQWPLEERSDSGSPRLKVPRGDSGGGWYRRKPAQAALGPSDPGKAGICRKRQLLQVHPCRPQALPAWTTSQALQPLRNPQGGTPGPAEVPRGGWRVRPLGGRRAEVGATLEEAAGALLWPRGLRAQDGTDGLVKDGLQASLGEG